MRVNLQVLNECFMIDESCHSGLRWKGRPLYHFSSYAGFTRWNRRYSGKPAGTKQLHIINKERWVVCLSLKSKQYLIKSHRVVYAIYNNIEPTDLIDHKDRSSSNNISNLRLCNTSENQWNTDKKSHNTSGYKGVSFLKGKYTSRITVNKKFIWLGRFEKAEDAAKAYIEASKKHHGKFSIFK